jgi:MSHA biogenesis protein MshQ
VVDCVAKPERGVVTNLSFEVFTQCLAVLRRPVMVGWALLSWLCMASTAHAANYTFPGSLPGGCSGSGISYTCGALTLASGDTVAVTNASTNITFTSLNTNNAQINAAARANLTLNVSGTLTVASGASITANVNAGNVSSSGGATYVGNLTTTTGAISLGAGTTVSGALTTTTGAITLLTGTAGTYTTVGSINSGGTVTINSYNRVNGPVVGYLLSASGNNTINGSITSKTTYVSLGGNATVNGSIYSQTYVDTGSNSNITGSITAATSYIDTGTATTVGGSLSALGTYVDIHGSASVGGSIFAKSYVSMTTSSSVGGNVTAETTIAMGSGSTVAQCVRSKNANTITVPSAGAVGGACCGAGSTCVNTCATGSPKPTTCSWPQSGLVAEYRFEESSYNGTEGEVIDSSGNDWHGKIVGATTSTASGKFCRGILVPQNLGATIDAFNTGIDINTIGNNGTAAFWYKSVASGHEHRMLMDATESTSGKFYLYRDDSGTGVDLNAHLTDGGATVRNVDDLNVISDGEWAHIVITWKFTTGTHTSRMRLYVNGVQKDEQTYTVASGAIASAISTLYFGDNRSTSSVELNSANGYIDQIKLYNAELTAAEVATVYAESPSCTPAGPHHIEVTTGSSSGVTCTPVTYTIKACANADCSSTYTSGLTGNLNLTGTPTVIYSSAFSIAPGSATTTVSAHITTAGTVEAALSGLSATPTNSPQVFCGIGAAASSGGSCVYTASDSALLFDVPTHASEVEQSVTVSAVKSSNNATVCTPAFASVDKAVLFKCTYSNPVSGTKPVRVADGTYNTYGSLNSGNSTSVSCDGTGRSITMAFNASGIATAKVKYADVGQMGMTARYDGSGSDAGLIMQGSDSFIAAPASFTLSGVTSGNIAAGSSFVATVTANNSLGATTPNFGNETSPATATMSFTKYRPTGVNAQSGSFSGSLGSFSNGVATSSNLAWSEVGTGDLTATLTGASYLGSGLSATGTTGSTGSVGPFVPHHFTTETTQACGVFTYSGQPFAVTVRALNAAGNPTQNYDGTANTSPNQANAVTLSAGSNGGTGSMSPSSVLASSFDQGVASVSTPVYSFTSKQTGPTSITVRAVDNVNAAVSSSGFTEGSLPLRSGRLRFSNAFGSEMAALNLPVQTQYWSGKSWIKSDGDGCTSVLASAVALSGYTNAKGSSGTWTTSASPITMVNGAGTLSLSAPSPVATGTVNVALNLGSTSADNACLSTHPATTGANLGWLRSLNGNCAATYDRDPSARATFGIYSPETKKTIYVRPID